MSQSAIFTPSPTASGCIIGCDGSDHAGKPREQAECQAYSQFGDGSTVVPSEATSVYLVRYASISEGADASVVITHDDHEGSHLLEINPAEARQMAARLLNAADLADLRATGDAAAVASWAAASRG